MNKKKPQKKIKYRSLEDLKHDKSRQKLNKENAKFLAGMYLKYAEK